MKKLVFAFAALMSFNAFAQEAVQGELPARFLTTNLQQAAKTAAATDTILPPFTCSSPNDLLTFYTINDTIITGAFDLGGGASITEVGQALNLDGDPLEVYGIIGLTLFKEEGVNKGSFTTSLYDTTGGIAAAPMATSNAVAFDNVSDTAAASLFTHFTFSSPVTVNAPFWATIEVDNGSDRLSLASTANGCGGASIFKTNQSSNWSNYSGTFSVGGAPVQFSIHLWAEVDDATIGLDKNLISRKGLELYPNPAHNTATIKYELANENNVTLSIQDMSGRVVFTKRYEANGTQEIELDLSSFQSGIYTYQVVGEKKQLNGVFVKE